MKLTDTFVRKVKLKKVTKKTGIAIEEEHSNREKERGISEKGKIFGFFCILIFTNIAPN